MSKQNNVAKMISKAHKVAFFFVIDMKEGVSNGMRVTRVITDSEFSKDDILAIKALGAFQSGNMFYKSSPDKKYGWFDIAME